MTNNSNDVIVPTAQAAMLAIIFPSFPCNEAALASPSLSLCLNHFTWRRYALSCAPSSFPFAGSLNCVNFSNQVLPHDWVGGYEVIIFLVTVHPSELNSGIVLQCFLAS